jgi:hypothetical protein
MKSAEILTLSQGPDNQKKKKPYISLVWVGLGWWDNLRIYRATQSVFDPQPRTGSMVQAGSME